MNQYFKRLKTHPGVRSAATLSIAGAYFGSTNTSFPQWWQGALFGFIFMSLFVWGIVLITNIKRK